MATGITSVNYTTGGSNMFKSNNVSGGSDGPPAAMVEITVDSGASYGALVTITDAGGARNAVPVAIGQTRYFGSPIGAGRGILQVDIAGNGGTTTCSGGVTIR